jgi:hypothetical protein
MKPTYAIFSTPIDRGPCWRLSVIYAAMAGRCSPAGWPCGPSAFGSMRPISRYSSGPLRARWVIPNNSRTETTPPRSHVDHVVGATCVASSRKVRRPVCLSVTELKLLAFNDLVAKMGSFHWHMLSTTRSYVKHKSKNGRDRRGRVCARERARMRLRETGKQSKLF